jgi:uncharacterized protein YecE (DUF72 family)
LPNEAGVRNEQRVYIGCAGWTIARQHADRFPVVGSHLHRYAARFYGVEINSSFYRPHRPATYARWAASVPAAFRFAAKLPREITHKRRLADVGDLLARFLSEVEELDGKLGSLLVQLPPRLPYDLATAEAFFTALRDRFPGCVACEPRHPSWFTPVADQLLTRFHIGRVAADPAVVPAAATPGGWRGLVYYRLHGSPQTYYSAYSRNELTSVAERLIQSAASAGTWCVFDNTALGHATADALTVQQMVLAAGRA